MRRFLLALATALPLAFASQANAVTVVEGTDFAGGYNNAFNVGVLGLGAHSISGSIFNEASCPAVGPCSNVAGTDRVDTIQFTIANGFQLVLADVVLTNIVGQPGSFNIRLRSNTDLVGNTNANNGNLFSVLGVNDVTGLQTFRIVANTRANNANDGDTIGLDWTLNLMVTPIPLPAGALLVLTGLGALGVARRRRQTA